MRRKYLLSAAMLPVLLAMSACEAGSPAPVASSQPTRLAGSSHGDGSTSQPEIGISQWNAAEAAKKAKTGPAAAAKAESAAKTKPAATAKAKSAAKTGLATAAKEKSAAKAAAAKAAAAEKAAAAAAKKKAEAQKKAAAKTQPPASPLKRTIPVPVTPNTAPAPVRQGSAEQTVRSACGTADLLNYNTPEGSDGISLHVLPETDGGTGVDVGRLDGFLCLD